MTVSEIFQKIGLWALFFFAQLLLFKNLYLGGLFNPQVYPLFFLMLSFGVNRYWLLILGFLLGLSIDVFMFSYGMHALATVVLCYLRVFVLRFISPLDAYEIEKSPFSSKYSNGAFFQYIFILMLVFHMVLFVVEKGSFSEFHITIFYAFLSSIVSVFMAFLIRILMKK